MKREVAILASGNGTNAAALLRACADDTFPARVACIVCNVPGAGVLEVGRGAGIAVHVVPSVGRSRAVFEAELLERIGPRGDTPAEIVCLAGFMRVLTPAVVQAFPERILNVHPSLLPSFPGLHAHRQALRAGVVQTGATVHLVDDGLDTGPILAQGTVPVLDDDDESTLAARVRQVEHALYPRALRWVAEGRVRVDGRCARVRLDPGEARWHAWPVSHP